MTQILGRMTIVEIICPTTVWNERRSQQFSPQNQRSKMERNISLFGLSIFDARGFVLTNFKECWKIVSYNFKMLKNRIFENNFKNDEKP